MGGKQSISRLFKNSKKNIANDYKIATCPGCSMVFYNNTHSFEDIKLHNEECSGNIKDKVEDLNAKDLWMLRRVFKVREDFSSIRISWAQDHIILIIDRENLLSSSMDQVNRLSSYQMRSEFQINFKGENSQDAGGITKEWINLLIKVLFSKESKLFKLAKTQENQYTFTSNKSNYAEYYFAGRIIAKAIYENIPIEPVFSLLIYKHLIGLVVELSDIENIDSIVYNSLNFMLSSPTDGVFFESFVVEDDEQRKIELFDGGVEFETLKSFEFGIDAFKAGMFSVFPQQMIKNLFPHDFRYLMCGNPFINIHEWKQFTVYKGDFSSTHCVIIWFWEIIHKYNQQQLRDLLTFVTGTSRLSVDGFSGLKTIRGDPAPFTIEPMKYSYKALPRAHTCFNRLDLPLFPSKNELKAALDEILKYHFFGFGLE